MRISIVIPAFNAAETIDAAVRSVLVQTRPADEIIVVDDGSTDGTGDVARSLAPRDVVVIRTANGGAARARNVGIERAGGDVVAFLDADDTWEPSKLAVQAAAFAERDRLAAVMTNWVWLAPPPGRHTAPKFHLNADEWDRPLRGSGASLFRYAFSMNSSIVMARREILLQAPFNERLITAEDRDTWLRVVQSGDVLFSSQPLTTIRWRADSLSNADVNRDYAAMLGVLERYRALLNNAATRQWEARIHRQWAGRLLAGGDYRAALPHAWSRARREPQAIEAWWVLAKCAAHAITPGRERGRAAASGAKSSPP